ncbi:hypothetical protein Q8W71_31060 [Methylobacterium sp. NEAU 140]|uniref:hypothetical protein n=1 Tax=Methylobacterium sp. NEAU 140 TaxID=3064945 RepID=UPI002735DD59|nr:hypothetical protein [Methylobacterium sp. NEAU 140]MDP4027032.1 hypothetical protein [Methylobacterium sp. NEAU 140]
MRLRMPWRVGQKILESKEVPRGKGWVETQLKLTDFEPGEEKETELAEAVKQHLMCGEKLTRFYRLARRDIDRLQNDFVQTEVPPSELKDVFPMVLEDEDLAEIGSDPTVVQNIQFDDGLAVFFGSVRVVTTREPLEIDQMPEDAASALEGWDELIGVRHRRLHSIDVLWLPNDDDFVEVRADYPIGISRNVGEEVHRRVRNKIAELVGYDVLQTPVNLFPLIDGIYRQRDGKVVELSFGTTTASLKNEKMRRKRLCLRDEAYHRGGSAALELPIQPFNLSVVWQRRLGPNRFSLPELSLRSTSYESGSANPQLFDAVISKCMGHSDYDYVRGRILSYL